MLDTEAITKRHFNGSNLGFDQCRRMVEVGIRKGLDLAANHVACLPVALNNTVIVHELRELRAKLDS